MRKSRVLDAWKQKQLEAVKCLEKTQSEEKLGNIYEEGNPECHARR